MTQTSCEVLSGCDRPPRPSAAPPRMSPCSASAFPVVLLPALPVPELQCRSTGRLTNVCACVCVDFNLHLEEGQTLKREFQGHHLGQERGSTSEGWRAAAAARLAAGGSGIAAVGGTISAGPPWKDLLPDFLFSLDSPGLVGLSKYICHMLMRFCDVAILEKSPTSQRSVVY